MQALSPSVPSLIHCKSLTVKGPVKFESGVTIKGNVMLTNGEERWCSSSGGGTGGCALPAAPPAATESARATLTPLLTPRPRPPLRSHGQAHRRALAHV